MIFHWQWSWNSSLKDKPRSHGKKGNHFLTVLTIFFLSSLCQYNVFKCDDVNHKFNLGSTGKLGDRCTFDELFVHSFSLSFKIFHSPFHKTCKKSTQKAHLWQKENYSLARVKRELWFWHRWYNFRICDRKTRDLWTNCVSLDSILSCRTTKSQSSPRHNFIDHWSHVVL